MKYDLDPTLSSIKDLAYEIKIAQFKFQHSTDMDLESVNFILYL